MKTTLKITMLLLGLVFSCAAFAGLIGFFPTATFLSGEIAFSLFAVTGLMFIALDDYTYRPLVLRTAPGRIVPFRAASRPVALRRSDRLAA